MVSQQVVSFFHFRNKLFLVLIFSLFELIQIWLCVQDFFLGLWFNSVENDLALVNSHRVICLLTLHLIKVDDLFLFPAQLDYVGD